MPGLMDGYFGDLHLADPSFMAGGKRMNYNFDFGAIIQYVKGIQDQVCALVMLVMFIFNIFPEILLFS